MGETKITENMLEGYEIIHEAIMAGLHGFNIQVSIKTYVDANGAYVTITYPDRKSGTEEFNFVFDENGVSKGGLQKNRIRRFLAKMKQIIAEDNVISYGDANIEETMQKLEGLKNR